MAGSAEAVAVTTATGGNVIGTQLAGQNLLIINIGTHDVVVTPSSASLETTTPPAGVTLAAAGATIPAGSLSLGAVGSDTTWYAVSKTTTGEVLFLATGPVPAGSPPGIVLS